VDAPPDQKPQDTLPAGFRVCGTCRSRFSGDARFCPFDGEPLEAASAEPAKDPLIGTVVDARYEVQAVLGEGGMGIVYRVLHRALERPFALKALRPELSRDGDLGVRFTREAKAAASVAHPNVVQITDFGSLPSGQPYFVMELLVGEPLSSIVRRGGPIPAERAVKLLLQIVEALGAAHAAGVVHRDLKPDNILVCRTGGGGEIIKVLDFGLAKVAGQSRLTKNGVVFGTPHYMSPEQASGAVVDERTDIYALGVVMYEMFTGRVPFEADTYMGVLTKHLYVAPTPPSVLIGGTAVLGALEQVALRCLEKKVDRRYGSMEELRADLERVASFADDGSLTVLALELREPRAASTFVNPARDRPPDLGTRSMRMGTRGTSGRAAAFAVGAGLVVGAGLGGAYWALRPDAGRPASSGVVPPAGVTLATGSVAAPASPAASTPAIGPASEPAGAGAELRATRAPSHAGALVPAARRPKSGGSAANRRAGNDGVRSTAPAEGRNPSTSNEKMIGREIIDPWSQ
jgi:serine/threonine-protein kinase